MKSIEIWRNAVLKYSPKAKDFGEAVRFNRGPLISIWETYTQNRRDLGRLPATSPEFVAPYLLGFHLANVARTEGILERALRRGLKVPHPENGLRVVDIGCGTGAMSQAVLNILGRDTGISSLSFELFDRSRHLLACAKEMLTEADPRAQIRGAAIALEDSPLFNLSRKWTTENSQLTILCFGFVWNEIGGNRRAAEQVQRTLDFWLKAKEPAWIILCEPATEEGARATMTIRGFFVEDGWHAYYPCPKSVTCPMTRDERDWCYSEFDFRKPNELVEVEKILKLSRRTVGGSAYLFLNPAALKANGAQPGKPVVVGHPQTPSGKSQLLLCKGEELDRAQPPNHRDLPLRGTEF